MTPAYGESIEDLAAIYFRNPAVLEAQVSPSGEHIAFLSHHRGRRSLLVRNWDFEGGRGATVGSGENISRFWWMDDSTLFYEVTLWDAYIVGYERYVVADRRPERLDFFSQRRENILWSVPANLPNTRGTVLAAMRRPQQNFEPGGLYRLDVLNKRMIAVVANPGKLIHWISNPSGERIIGVELEPGKRFRFRNYDVRTGKWDDGSTLPAGVTPIIPAPDDEHLLVFFRNDEGFRGIGMWSAEREDFAPGSQFSVDGYDVDGAFVRDNFTGIPMGIRYHTDRPLTLWFDPNIREIFAALRRNFGDMTYDFVGFGPDRRYVFYRVSADNQIPGLVRLDLQTGNNAILGLEYPALSGRKLHSMKPVAFTARDGLELHGYLTVPEGFRKPGPVVFLIHGGPRVRDRWGFDVDVQFLAALGYSVMQVNYRGSSGYGKAISDVTFHEILQHAADDINDAAQWLIDQKIAEPGRFAVVGGSFGGFLAIEVAAREPERWAAAVGFAGVYEWDRQHADDYRRSGALGDLVFGDSELGEGTLASYSPARYAERIKAKVMLVHGGIDRRVRSRQAALMRRALTEVGNPPDYHTRAWGVHGFPDEAERIRYWTDVGNFLRAHIGSPEVEAP